MRKILLLSLVLLLLQGCVKDKCTSTFAYHLPVYKTTAAVRENIKSNAPKPLHQTGKLFIIGNYIFVNEIDRGIHVIDNTSPSNPKNVAFIDIPGNQDLALKGNTLYADAYTDLITLDVSNPNDVKVTNITENVFQNRAWYYTTVNDQNEPMVLVEYEKRDTTININCDGGGFWGTVTKDRPILYTETAGFANMDGNFSFNAGSGSTTGPVSGRGGSMARFTIVDNYLYTVTHSDLNVFNIQNATVPQFNNKHNVGMNIETIFPFKDRLFIGAFDGMYIYDISNRTEPKQESKFLHVASCDPVIADDTYAYVTLRSGSQCQGFTNQLEVINITDVTKPILKKVYEMVNPHGLSKDGNMLIVCDGEAGLKIYDATDPENMILTKTITDGRTHDVIAYNGLAIVVGEEGLYQYQYNSPTDIQFLSKIIITPVQ